MYVLYQIILSRDADAKIKTWNGAKKVKPKNQDLLNQGI